MRIGAQEQEKVRIGTGDLAPLPWLAVFDQDLSARILSAISYGPGFVILSDPAGIVPEQLSHIVERLHEAGFASTMLAAPLASLSMLQDAISAGMTGEAVLQRPLVVLIRQAEALSEATVGRLAALAELRRDGRPVLRFLLTGTPGLWSALRNAGLGHLEEDVAAHIRPGRTGAAHPLQPARPVLPADILAANRASPSAYPVGTAIGPDPRQRRFALAGAGLAGIGLAGFVAAGWFILSPGSVTQPIIAPQPAAAGAGRVAPPVSPPLASLPFASPAPAPRTASPDERFAALLDRERQEIAADHLSSPAGDNLIETRRQIDEVLPLLSSKTLHRLTEESARDAATPEQRPADNPATPALPAPGAGPPATASPGNSAVSTGTASTGTASTGTPSTGTASTGTPLTGTPSTGADAFDGTMHVTLRYSLGDRAAEARAVRLLALLRLHGILADGPEPTAAAIEHSSLSYYFAQDHDAALDLGQRLVPGIAQLRKPTPARGASDPPRPGEISISIGSRDDLIEAPAPPGKQT